MTDEEPIEIVASRLSARADELAAAHLGAFRAAFRQVGAGPDEMRSIARRDVSRVVDAIRGDGESAAGYETAPVWKAFDAVPLGAILEAYRVYFASMREVLIHEATDANMDADGALIGLRRLWELADRNAHDLARARDEEGGAAGGADEARRTALLRRLLLGTLDGTEWHGGALIDLSPGRDYWVFRGRQEGGAAAELTSRLREAGANATGSTLVTQIDGDVGGISTERPLPPDGSLIAVAGPADASSLAAAFAEASQVLRVASRFGLTGSVDMSSMSVRIAVDQNQQIGQVLHQRYVASLTAQGSAGADILNTVRAWVRQHRSVPATARLLSVHENTVRYRLARFLELTGGDLADSDTLVEVWWALEFHALVTQNDRTLRVNLTAGK